MSKIAFITGATSGFGAACARRFAADGWRLVLCGRRQERLEAVRAERRSGAGPRIPLGRSRQEAAVNAAVAALPTEFAEIDLLVNNAGLALGLEPAHRCDMEDWQRMVDTNIKGLIYCTRAVLGMVARDRGHIVNIGSVAGTYPYPGGNVYGATKAFVKQFSLNLRADLLGTRVRVTNVEPGLAESEFSLVRFKGDDTKAARNLRRYPATPSRGHRRHCALGSHSTGARQPEQRGSDAGMPSVRAVHDPSRELTQARTSLFAG